MFGLFKRKRPHVYSQWITPLLEFSSDTTEFYAAIEEGLKKWQVPELVTERIIYKDGGFLSPGRVYLRVRRELLVFDIVSAKFGASWWWFSCRSAVLQRSLRIWEILVFLAATGAFAASYIYTFGPVIGGVALASTLLMLLTVMVAARSWNGLDDLLLRLPVIGAFYQSLFRAESYYRDDSRRMYVTVVDHLVREKVREFAAAAGFNDVPFNEVSDIQQITTFTDRVKQAAGEVAGRLVEAAVAKGGGRSHSGHS
jgi:hypothetical protein